MNSDIKRRLIDTMVTYQTMGDEERAILLGDALTVIRDLEESIIYADQQITTLKKIAAKADMRLVQ